MTDDLQAHYRRLFDMHGDSPLSVQYSDKESQHKRFEVLAAIDDDLGSVLDIGAGLGHMLTWLRSQGFAGKYHGVDFVDEFVDHASATFADDALAAFAKTDLRTGTLPSGFDYALANGVFNNLAEDNMGFLESTITRMFEVANKGIAFNALSTYVDYQVVGLFYADPREVFDFCKVNLSRRVVLRHEYVTRADTIPFEFTMYVCR